MSFENKNQIRKEILHIRNSLKKEEIENKSRKIFKRLSNMDIYLNSNIIMCYMDFRNEVSTREFIIESLSGNKRIVLPLVDTSKKDKKTIIPYEIINLDTDLKKGTLGILEPKKECKRFKNPKDIELIIVPGVAFDIFKNRIGYGAGYYDRFLKTLKKDCRKIGVAFELQVLDCIKAEKHDVPLDIIITEERVIA